MKCLKCSSLNVCKNGKMYGMQRYKCKDCNYNYTKGRNSKDKSLKRFALELYLEGLGFRSIGRLIKVSHVSVFNWVKQYGKSLDLLQNDHDICITEIDEMHSYIGSKKTQSGSRLLLIDMQKNSSTSLLAIDRQRLGNNFGKE